MPTGAYLLSDSDGPYAVERFTCAPGPAGWRYTASRTDPVTGADLGRLDLTLDDGGRAVRLDVSSGSWEVRGGVTGPSAVWRRGPDEHAVEASGFTGTSPAFAVATARLLRLSVGVPVRVRLVRLGDAALAALTVDEGWALTSVEGDLSVERYEVADLATGGRRVLHLVGDVVVDGTGITLLELETPPTLTRR